MRVKGETVVTKEPDFRGQVWTFDPVYETLWQLPRDAMSSWGVRERECVKVGSMVDPTFGQRDYYVAVDLLYSQNELQLLYGGYDLFPTRREALAVWLNRVESIGQDASQRIEHIKTELDDEAKTP